MVSSIVVSTLDITEEEVKILKEESPKFEIIGSFEKIESF